MLEKNDPGLTIIHDPNNVKDMNKGNYFKRTRRNWVTWEKREGLEKTLIWELIIIIKSYDYIYIICI